MVRSSAKFQAACAAVTALLLAGGWALFGTGLRVRWLVTRGAPPAKGEPAAKALADIRALGLEARPALLGILHGSGTRARRSWVAGALLRGPFFDSAEVEKALGSPDVRTARAAAFALMDGDSGAVSFEETASKVEMSPWKGGPSASPRDAWDPAPAIPVLVEWLADRADIEARHAARLLGRIPPGDDRVKEALLKCVEEVPNLAAAGAPVAVQVRKSVAVDCLQSLLAWARDHEDVPARVSKVLLWIEKEEKSETQWDIESYALRLLEVARGNGVDPAVLEAVAHSKNPIVRQTLANVLETMRWEGTGGLLKELLRDEAWQVRRAAVLTLRKRTDPLLLELAPWIVEDSMIFVRGDCLRALGELNGVSPKGCRDALPLLVSCLEEPWPGPEPGPGAPLAPYIASAKAEVVEGCAVSLYRIARSAPGFGEDGINDMKKRFEISRRLAGSAEERKKVVAEWRKSVPARKEADRVPHLARRLEDRDPANVVRAAKELKRITGDATGFPKEVLEGPEDETAARNAVREARKKGEWEKTVAYWRKRQ